MLNLLDLAMIPEIIPVTAILVTVVAALTDAIYVLFTAAVAARRRVRAANWSAVWYASAAISIVSYVHSPVYVVFAALGSWIGAYVTVGRLDR